MNRTDWKERDTIIFGEPVDWTTVKGSCPRFEGVGLDKLKELVDKDFVDLEDAQNCAPTYGEIVEFIKQYPEITAHGYIVSPNRADYRVTLEGVEYSGAISQELRKDFIDMFRKADDFICDREKLFCWYD
jgi:hypothetical protein